MKHAPFARRAAALALACLMSLQSQVTIAGNLGQELGQMFDNLGSVSNVTDPGAFRGQALSTYTGGSLYYRTPARNYQLFSLALPSVKAGCGGIDAFMGSFSHISGDQLRDMLAQIGTNLVGIAFQAALDSISPLLGGIVKSMQKLASDVNARTINSCETAKLIAGTVSDQMGWSVESTCAYLAQAVGRADDPAAGRELCRNSNTSETMDLARSSPDPAVNKVPPFVGNLTWSALKQIPSLDDAAREIVMSIVGTTVYYKEDAGRGPQDYAPRISDVRHLLYGDTAGASGSIGVAVYRCDTADACLNPVLDTQTVAQPLNERVRLVLTDLADRIRTRTAIPASSPSLGFVNSTSIPVWRMLSIGTSVRDASNPASGLANTLIERYKDVIAADYAITFLTQFSEFGTTALSRNYELMPAQADKAKELRGNAMSLRLALNQERQRLNTAVVANTAFITEMETLERTLRTSMPAYVQEMLGNRMVSK